MTLESTSTGHSPLSNHHFFLSLSRSPLSSNRRTARPIWFLHKTSLQLGIINKFFFKPFISVRRLSMMRRTNLFHCSMLKTRSAALHYRAKTDKLHSYNYIKSILTELTLQMNPFSNFLLLVRFFRYSLYFLSIPFVDNLHSL